MTDLTDRLLARREVTADGCWEWLGHRTPERYGVIAIQGRSQSVHRVSYELFVGGIPAGLMMDHLCRNPPCFNPDHLEPVTPFENTHRSPISPAAVNARKVTCLNGHPFDDENTYTREGRRERLCRICRHEATRRYRARRATAVIEQARADEHAATDTGYDSAAAMLRVAGDAAARTLAALR